MKPPSDTFSFGDSRYLPKSAPTELAPVSGEPAAVRQMLRERLQSAPGVYGMLDREGQLCYVGVSGRLRDRVVSYFQKQPDGAKAARIAQVTTAVVWEPAGHEFTARLRELELIRRHLPRFNVKGRHDRRRLGYLFLTTHDAPRLALERLPHRGVRYVWGPLVINRQAKDAVDRLNHLFRLRDCSPRTPIAFADQGTLFTIGQSVTCPRLGMDTCLAPCVAACSRADYSRQVERLRALLDGRDDSPLEELRAKMDAAADLRRYELAAHYRDALDEILPLVGRITELRTSQQSEPFVYSVPGPSRRRILHVIIDGQVQLSTRGRMPPASLSAVAAEPDLEIVRIVRRWFQEHPDEWSRVQPLDPPRVAC